MTLKGEKYGRKVIQKPHRTDLEEVKEIKDHLNSKLYVHLNVWREPDIFPVLKSQGQRLLDVIPDAREQFRHVHLKFFKCPIYIMYRESRALQCVCVCERERESTSRGCN